jgi:hypothetical protein
MQGFFCSSDVSEVEQVRNGSLNKHRNSIKICYSDCILEIE